MLTGQFYFFLFWELPLLVIGMLVFCLLIPYNNSLSFIAFMFLTMTFDCFFKYTDKNVRSQLF